MPESWKSRLTRWSLNLIPAFRGSGGRLTYVAADFSEVRLALPLSWRTRNYVGTMFGGSMYASVDPIYMVMLIKRLGPAYVVWDKSATIRFLKPGRGTLRAQFRVDDSELALIRSELANVSSLDRIYQVELVDSAGVVCAAIEKTLYIRLKDRGALPIAPGATVAIESQPPVD
jgi:acyl-coenzyme A thioesterase PaaI-like protein